MSEIPPFRPPPPLLDDGCALFLDVDGTLIDFADDPAKVQLLPQVREAIGALSDRLGGAVALVSGRPLRQLDALFAPLRLPAAGLHGHEMRDEDAARADMPEADDTASWLHGLHQRATHMALSHPGVMVENKGVSMALHWRSAPESADAVLAFAHDQIGQLSGYRLQPGDHVVEFIPQGSDKGVAVETLMRRAPFLGRVPVFVGDDLTDEYGFAAAQRLGGWAVRVGHREPSQARHALPDTRAVHAWLQENAAPR